MTPWLWGLLPDNEAVLRRCARHDAWTAAAEALDLDAEALRGRVRELAEAAPDAFSATARSPEVEAIASDLPVRLSI